MVRRVAFLIQASLIACAAAWAADGPTPEEMAQSRVRLQAIRKNPEHYARLRENFNAFNNLGERRKEALVKLDADVHDLPAPKQARYWKTLERYAVWLESLKKSEIKEYRDAYKAIVEAPDAAARLSLIEEQRNREWMKTQPKKCRDDWEKLPAADRVKFVTNLRQQERQSHQRWVIAQRFWKELENKKELPCRMSDFGVTLKNKDGKPQLNPDNTPKQNNKVADYFNDYLVRYLTAEEKDQLKKAEGLWPDFPQTLVAIASKYPSALPPARKEDYPTGPDKLPAPVRIRVTEKKGGGPKTKKNDLKQFENRPIYGEKVVELGTNKGSQPFDFEFWACSYNALQAPMKAFVNDQLTPRLTTKEQAEINEFEGRWPYYPNKIQELAKKYNLDPPWHFLPDQNKWHWDRYRPARFQSSEGSPTAQKSDP